MNLPNNLVNKIISEGYSERFDKTFYLDGKEYHYFVNNSIFFSQLSRIYSLLAKEVGVSSAEYDYIRINGKNLLYVPSICKIGEKLYESNILPETKDVRTYFDYVSIWEEVISKLPFKDIESSMEEFYKQWFFALLIFDDDKQISIVKDSNDLFRLGEYFDYGGVYMMQDSHEIDNNIFYDKELFDEFSSEYKDGEIYTNEKLQKDLEFCIKRSVIDDIVWRDGFDETLKLILPNVTIEFIDKCFDIDILDVIDNDNAHEYSDNFKKVIRVMFETSKNLLRTKINNFSNSQVDVEQEIRTK